MLQVPVAYRTSLLIVCACIALLLLVCGCIHSGAKSSAVKSPVPDSVVVLVKKGNAYGAFIPRKQLMTNEETLAYDWYYRTDGKGTFVSGVKIGHGNGTPIKFGPFEVSWSGKEDGKGWIYYDRFPGDTVRPDDIRICVTSLKDIRKVDATDRKWVYKGSP